MNNRIALWRNAPDADAAEELAALLGWATVLIEVPTGTGRRGFFRACAEAFGFPKYFSANWDAFEECLISQEFEEVEDLDEADGLLVLWAGWGDLAESEPDQFALAIEVFREVLASWEADDLDARVVLVGDGPAFSLQPVRTPELAFGDDDDELLERPDLH